MKRYRFNTKLSVCCGQIDPSLKKKKKKKIDFDSVLSGGGGGGSDATGGGVGGRNVSFLEPEEAQAKQEGGGLV